MAWIVATGTAGAHTGDFRGVVLSIQASRGEAIVRHEALGGIPGATAAYKIVPAADLKRLHPDDRISARVDDEKKPPELREIAVLPAAAAAGALQTVANLHILQEGERVPPTRFVDQRGRPFTFTSLRGRDVVLAFIYTRCRDARMCPLITAKFGQLRRAFKGRDVALVEVTLDPQYDTPPVLTKYARLFGADWTFATGPAADVLAFDAQFGIQPFADPSFGLIHTERTVILDKRGAIAYLVDDPGWEPAGIVAQVDQIDNRSNNWFARADLALSRAAVAVCGDRVAGFSGLLDLLVFGVILAAFGWGFYRIGRAIVSAKP